ncbi:MAG: hypothetical protein PWP48_710 [Clostridiales bacterium]|nr:hypothetical protein [Clostridiales bacterium]MDK2991477.1 hypothetical protein [Clostridiales bacterium]
MIFFIANYTKQQYTAITELVNKFLTKIPYRFVADRLFILG